MADIIMTWFLILSVTLIVGGFGSAIYTGSFVYDAGYMGWFIGGIFAGLFGILLFLAWLFVHAMLKV